MPVSPEGLQPVSTVPYRRGKVPSHHEVLESLQWSHEQQRNKAGSLNDAPQEKCLY